MSAIAASLRRQWIPVATLGLIAVAIVTWLLAGHYISSGGSTSTLPQAAPAVDQAPWKIDRSFEGTDGKLSAHEKKALLARSDGAVDLVKNVFDGIFLNPGDLDEIVGKTFSKDAARSLHARSLGFPDGSTEVKTLTRHADVGVSSDGARFATAEVRIVASANAGSKDLKVKQAATLWIERDGGSWQVVAFDVDQKPAK
ncbi:MAG TPA: hypothetical protein VFK89_00475 [Actinomycetota bacterium]|nr:hypothetical protein [Actinomycetota bacterium]